MDTLVTDAARLPLLVQQHLGQLLAAAYLSNATSSEQLIALIERLKEALGAYEEAEAAFRAEFLSHTPHVRGFARSLAKNPDVADDLVQETMLKAWRCRSSYTPGTNLGAWLFTILRNTFYSRHRKHYAEVQDIDGFNAARLSTNPDQQHVIELKDAQNAILQLKPFMREALVLVAIENLTYEEAAAVMNCSVGTVKSRVWRARDELAHRLAG